MIIATTNFSGNVGKSIFAKHILMPRLTDATLVNIESINAGNDEGVRLRAAQFETLQDMVLDGGNLVMDIGASNVEQFFASMREFDGSHHDIDRYIIPVVPETKQQIDTIATIKALRAMGIDAQKIRVIFNRCNRLTRPRDQFPAIFGYHKESKAFRLDERAAVHDSPIYDFAKQLDRSIADLATADEAESKAALRDASDRAARELKTTIKAIRLAKPILPELDAAFAFMVED